MTCFSVFVCSNQSWEVSSPQCLRFAIKWIEYCHILWLVRLWSDQLCWPLDLIILNSNAYMTGCYVPLTWALSCVLWNAYFSMKIISNKIQLQTVDHSVRWSMKNAASCVKRCEMQDTPSTWFSNAYCSLGSFPGLRLSEGLYEIKLIVKVCMSSIPNIMLYSRQTYSSSDQQTRPASLTLMHVIVQFIGDNGRTPQVLLAIVLFGRCL